MADASWMIAKEAYRRIRQAAPLELRVEQVDISGFYGEKSQKHNLMSHICVFLTQSKPSSYDSEVQECEQVCDVPAGPYRHQLAGMVHWGHGHALSRAQWAGNASGLCGHIYSDLGIACLCPGPISAGYVREYHQGYPPTYLHAFSDTQHPCFLTQ